MDRRVLTYLLPIIIFISAGGTIHAQSCNAIQGDANNDGRVTLVDFETWRRVFRGTGGNPTMPPGQSTPVPTLPPGTNAAKVKEWDDKLFPQLNKFKEHILEQIVGKSTSPDSGGAYSSALGLGVYHTMDEMTALAYAIENSPDPARRAAYAEAAVEPLNIITDAVNRLGFRYLDEAHGTGGVGFVLNAMYNDPTLRQTYASQLTGWANKIKPVVDRNFNRTNVSDAPHMSAKISAGFLAVGKILNDPKYINGFTEIRNGIIDEIQPSGWVSDLNDVSHTSITVQALHLAYKEQQRGVLTNTGGVTKTHLTNFAIAFMERSSLSNMNYGFPVLVFAHPPLEQQAQNVNVTFSGSLGSHGLARHFNTAGGLMAGYNTQ